MDLMGYNILVTILNAANENVDKSNGILVLHRSMREHPKFKVYKNFHYDLYLVKANNINGKGKIADKELLIHRIIQKNAPADKIEEIWDECDFEFLSFFIKWLGTEQYKDLCNEV